MDHEKVLAYAKANGYAGAEYLGQYEGFFCYNPILDYPNSEEVPPTGLPTLLLVNRNGDIRSSSPEEAFCIGDRLKNQLETDFTASFGGYFFYAVPDGQYIYQRRGRDYRLDGSEVNPDAVMKASLEQGKNLLIKTFPAVELYPDSNAVY